MSGFTLSQDADAVELRAVAKKPESFEMKEFSHKVHNSQYAEKKSSMDENEEIDKEQVFEHLTLKLPTTQNSVRSFVDAEGNQYAKEEEHTVRKVNYSAIYNSQKAEGRSEYVEFALEETTESETSSTDSDEGFDHVQSVLPSFTSVLYSKDHVSMFPRKNAKLSGRLSVIKQHSVVFLTWVPSIDVYSNLPIEAVKKNELAPVPLQEIQAITRHTPTLGWHYIVIVFNSGHSFPPLYFNNGGVRSLISTLKQHANLVKAMNDPNTFFINESPDPLKRSLQSMDLDDVFLGCVAVDNGSLETKTLSGALSTFTQLALETTSNLFYVDLATDNHDRAEIGTQKETPNHNKNETVRKKQEISPEEKPTSTCSILNPTTSSNQSESLNIEKSQWTEVGSFEFLDDLAARPTHRFDSLKGKDDWGKQISLSELKSFFDSDGRMINLSKFRERVFYGGFSSETRKMGWKYLFGLWKEDWTKEECKHTSIEKERHYDLLRGQWESITADQEKRFSKWRERKTKIEKDVRRTDRCHQFYKYEHGEPLKALKRIMTCYVMYNFDLSYCQGMSDLASPILYVMMKDVKQKNSSEWKLAEAEAFWCFSGMMDRVEGNFNTDQRGMHSQLLAIEKLLQLLDPQLYAHFKLHDCLNFFFCFRWILILYKREFAFSDVLRLWDAFFSKHKTSYFHLYFCIAILVTHRNTILQDEMDFETLLKFCLELTGNIDLMPMLKLANVLSAWAEPIEKDCLADIF